jgi:hypothetical protein
MYCPTCSKQFKRKHAYQSHILSCPKLFDDSTNNDIILPSSLQMYHMIMELNKKCKKMENEISYLRKLNLKQKKDNEQDWISKNYNCDLCWENFIDNIIIDYHMEDLFENDLVEVMKIILNNIFENYNNKLPFIIFKHCKNSAYIFNRENTWEKHDKSILHKIYEIIHKKLLENFNIWTENNNLSIETNAKKYNNTVIKLLGSKEDSLQKTFMKLNNFTINLNCIQI